MTVLNATAVLQKLKTMGTAQNRKVYARHGFGENMFGVSHANLGILKKRIKVNHELAAELWESGNLDARVLAMKIADPGVVTARQIDGWMRDSDNTVLVDGVTGVVARSRFADSRRNKWVKSKAEWTGRSGWNLVNSLAGSEDDISDRVFVEYLKLIETEIHGSRNRIREAMNYALIRIGTRNVALHKKAVAAAKKIGTVHLDHGETGCKTPDAIPYMERALEQQRVVAARRAKKAAGRKTATGARKTA